MKYFVMGSTYVIRLETGEQILATLSGLCERDKIGSGFFSGLGAVGEAEIGHFDPVAKAYSTIKVIEPCEIVSFHGNVSWQDDRPFIHAHIGLGRKDFSLLGGHLREAVVSATCEVYLTSFRDEIVRRKNVETGLSLLDLKPGGEWD